MKYDILSAVIELTDSDAPLSARLPGVANLLAKKMGFASCSIFIFDKESSEFCLAASTGRKFSQKEYSLIILPLLTTARASGSFVESPAMGGAADRKTSKAAFIAYPLQNGEKNYGAVLFKQKGSKRQNIANKNLLPVIIRHLTYTVKSDRNIKKLKKLHDERKRLESRLTQAEKIMALGELSATLAHEIKTPLVSIGGYASRLKKKIALESPYSGYLDYISNSVAKLENLIDEILAFASEKALKFVPTDMNALVKESISMFSESARTYGIEVRTDFTKSPATIAADQTLLKVAIDNILANAIQSMPGGGTLEITTNAEDGLAAIEIADTGGGIEPALLGDIFNPFYTTKETGTGLGLTITHKIISRHKGSIDVVNSYGQGMKFIIRVHLTSGEK